MNKKEKTSTIILSIAALNYYYTKILKRNIMKTIRRPKLEKTIPDILEKEDILKMIETTKNQKHRLLIKLLYSSGVRISEALNLKKENILLEKKLLIIRAGKGKKDRITILSDVFINDYLAFLPNVKNYVFESSHILNKPISIRTAEMIIENAARMARITKTVYPHMIRRSFATHLLDKGTRLHTISHLLGHSHIETTRNAYIKFRTSHLENIQSPMDAV